MSDSLLDLMGNRVERQKKKTEVMKILRSHDLEGSGYISMIQLYVMMNNNFSGKLTDEEVEEIVNSSDIDANGRMRYDRFARALFDKI